MKFGGLPLHWGIVQVGLLHNHNYAINGGGTKHNRDSPAESGIIINNKSNLIFIVFWYSFHLYTYYHIPHQVGLSTHAHEGNSSTVWAHTVV